MIEERNAAMREDLAESGQEADLGALGLLPQRLTLKRVAEWSAREGHMPPLPDPEATPEVERGGPGKGGSKRNAKAMKVLACARDAALETGALKNLRRDRYTRKAQGVINSRLQLYEDWCREKTWAPYPLQVEQLEKYCAALKYAQYSTARSYVSAVIQENARRGGSLGKAEETYLRQVGRAMDRDKGAEEKVVACTIEHLIANAKNIEEEHELLCMEIGEEVAGKHMREPRARHTLYVLAFFFVLRIDEATALKSDKGQYRIDHDKNMLWLNLARSKTDPTGRGAVRKQGCCCEQEPRICPVHVLLAWVRDYAHDEQDVFLVSTQTGDCYAYAMLLAGWRDDVVKTRIPTEEGVGKAVWGLHSFRRGGAQALAAAGYDLPTIQLFARWASSAVARYVAEAPLLRSHLYATAMASVVWAGEVEDAARDLAKEAEKIGGPTTNDLKKEEERAKEAAQGRLAHGGEPELARRLTGSGQLDEEEVVKENTVIDVDQEDLRFVKNLHPRSGLVHIKRGATNATWCHWRYGELQNARYEETQEWPDHVAKCTVCWKVGDHFTSSEEEEELEEEHTELDSLLEATEPRRQVGDEEDLGADDAEEDVEILDAQSAPREVDLVDA